MIILAARYDTGEPVTVEFDGPRIRRVVRRGEANRSTPMGPWVAPGFIDIQVNGYGGQPFSAADLTVEGVASILETYLSFGTTRVCPTVTTNSTKVMRHAIATLVEATASDPRFGRLVAGIHVEGPYISPNDGPRGAHPKQFTRPPDWDEFQRFQEAAKGTIRIVTLSPEYAEAESFIARATAAGIVVAIGHTSATGEQIRAAVDAGARLSTHLGNGSHLKLRRHPNYIWNQMAEDRLTASIIADGHHLPGEVVRVIVRAKTPGRIILTSDLSGFAGVPRGIHASETGDVEMLADGRLVVAGEPRLLAGASRPIGTCVAQAMHMADLNLSTAVEMATREPAELLGLPFRGLRPGDAADLVLFDLQHEAFGPPTLNVVATILAGQCVYGQVPMLD